MTQHHEEKKPIEKKDRTTPQLWARREKIKKHISLLNAELIEIENKLQSELDSAKNES